MLYMLIIALAISVASGAYLAFANRKLNHLVDTTKDFFFEMMEENTKAEAAWIEGYTRLEEEWAEKYVALEQGMSEQEENYEMQFLSLNEEIQVHVARNSQMQEDLDILQDMLDYHHATCLPDLAFIRAASEAARRA